MEVIKIEEEFLPRGSGEPRSNDPDRPHLTDIISSIEDEMGWGYKGSGFGGPWLTMELGFMWENVLSYALAERYAMRVGEVELDGIVGSPDGMSSYDPLHKVDMVLEEYKCTWKSTRNPIEKHWRYMTQVKSYCHMVGVSVVVMRVLYVVGDHWGHGPQYGVYRIEFMPVELEENWRMILQQARKMKEEREEK